MDPKINNKKMYKITCKLDDGREFYSNRNIKEEVLYFIDETIQYYYDIIECINIVSVNE